MAQQKFGSAGVTATEIDLSGPVAQQPVGVPAGVIGTSVKGPAFVPITVGVIDDFFAKFGATDGKKFGPLAVSEWLRNAGALTYIRVLGCGDGTQRNAAGDVNNAGFTVGENEPDPTNNGQLSANPYANLGGPAGRTYFLGCFMSESAGSTGFSGPGAQTNPTAVPIVRGVLMAASGVILRLSSSAENVNGLVGSGTNAAVNSSAPPGSSMVASDAVASGTLLGSVVLLQGSVAKQDFVLLLNGLKGTDPKNPNVITASFDMTSPNYFANVLNTDPYNMQAAGHFLYAHWDIYPTGAVVTGSGLLSASAGAGAATAAAAGQESSAFLLTGSAARDTATPYVPDYEDFRDRFGHARSPWVISQPFGGKAQNLFRVHALDDGSGVSTLYKMSVENIALSTDPNNLYPTFDLVVRDWEDNDSAPVYLEQWRGLVLNPDDSRYIAKVIGDQYSFFDFDRGPTAQKLAVNGNYPNASNLIRVEVDPSVDSAEADPTSMPVGIRGPAHLVTSGTMPMTSVTSGQLLVADAAKRVVQRPVPMRISITQGSGAKLMVNPLLYWGFKFEHGTSLSTPNLSTLPDLSLQAFASYFPSFRTDSPGFVVGDNAGTAPTSQNGVMDSDLFNNNSFTLMNIQVVTNSSGIADSTKWANATYVRNGNITTNQGNATRALVPSDFVQSNRRFLKWSFFLQGGFNGTNLFDIDQATLDNVAVEDDMNASNRGAQTGGTVSAYTTALKIMGDVVNTDLQLLAVPGIRHPVVTDAAISSVESRFDALFLMDIEQLDNNGATVTQDSQQPSVTLTAANFANRALNSSFGAAYFPDVVMPDPTTQTNVLVPPSVVVLGAMALNDRVGHPWFAPAGFTRGALQTTLEARVKLSKTNMDVLYDVNINPLVAFPGNATGGTNPKGGVVVWGQKTLQQAASALDRVNVRRLLIEIRRQVRDIALTILFEPNRDATLAKFSAAVTPRLQRIQAQAGLERFKVVIDSSTTTQLDVENNTVRGKIFVQPTKSIEFVSLDFVVTNNIQQQQ